MGMGECAAGPGWWHRTLGCMLQEWMYGAGAGEWVCDGPRCVLHAFHGVVTTRGLVILHVNVQPAPIQVSYMGFCGTMGADYIQYMVGDRTVIPQSCRCVCAHVHNRAHDGLHRFAVSRMFDPLALFPWPARGGTL